MWMAGGGIQGGLAYGSTDDYGWYARDNKVHVHDLHATILHLMGINHEKLTYRYSGRDYRLTDVSGMSGAHYRMISSCIRYRVISHGPL